MALSDLEIKILEKCSSGRDLSAKTISTELNLEFSTVSSLLEKLHSEELIQILQKTQITKFVYTKKGKETSLSGLPESILLQRFLNAPDVFISQLDKEEKSFGLSQGIKNGWFIVSKEEGGKIILTQKAKEILQKKQWPTLPPEEELNSCDKNFLSQLTQRGLVEKKNLVVDYIFKITLKGKEVLEKIKISSKPSIAQLNREMLISGSWRKGDLVPYNLSIDVEPITIAKSHPITLLKRKIKKVFISLGFKEMDGPLVESCFWNFDALFQPQDHPARDLADTFYINRTSPLPEEKLVKKIKAVHEKKWGGKWSEEFASKTVLRTHTTSLSARTLFNKKDDLPDKFFAIGKVFRNEATDYKHLAEFYQVEGIVVWKEANFCHLLGVLKEFYLKLGFEKIRFRPSYFPYTEPSLEIEFFDKSKNQWLELGGAGIFRPEVCLPLCGVYPVLAWGLSLERPLMLSHYIPDIRSIYRNEIEWIRNFK
ncbi:MAG: phenylalanine--tRNA ligase subunit alpha [Candidatus Anstonellaceae archaeon]